MEAQGNKQLQASRVGKSAITFFVPTNMKAEIKAALVNAGYGLSFQEGIAQLLDELLRSQNRSDLMERRISDTLHWLESIRAEVI